MECFCDKSYQDTKKLKKIPKKILTNIGAYATIYLANKSDLAICCFFCKLFAKMLFLFGLNAKF